MRKKSFIMVVAVKPHPMQMALDQYVRREGEKAVALNTGLTKGFLEGWRAAEIHFKHKAELKGLKLQDL